MMDPEGYTVNGAAGYEEILRTYNPIDIAMVKSLLDQEGIDYFFRDEHFGYAYPFAQPARLMVRREQAFEAREILRELALSYSVSASVPRPPSRAGGTRPVVVRLHPNGMRDLPGDAAEVPDGDGGKPGGGESGCA